MSKAKAKEGASHSDEVAESGLVHLLPIEDGGLEKVSSLKPLVVTSDGGCGGGRNSEGLVFLLLMRAAVLVLERVRQLNTPGRMSSLSDDAPIFTLINGFSTRGLGRSYA